MKIYAVGGCVRDELMRASGLQAETGDRDWVVVGSSPEEMVRLGFTPVGTGFPVFLHPKTHEEYALARTERKTGTGYHGFVFHASPDVTLEEDLRRRDLTVNAMARGEDGVLVDPFGGRRDIENRVLRHVSGAFAEDPVRILRLARFAARFPDFTVAPETQALLRTMVASGEADALVPERVWAEISRGLMERTPSRMLRILEECGCWARLCPEVPLSGEILARADRAASRSEPLPVRAACVFCGVPEETSAQTLDALRAPAEVRELAAAACRWAQKIPELRTAEELSELFAGADALRRPERFAQLLSVSEIVFGESPLPLRALAQAWRSVDAGAVARGQSDRRKIPQAVAQARREAVAAALRKSAENQ